MPCPVCKTDFEIPPKGVADLTVQTFDKETPRSAASEVCAEHGDLLRMYCLKCGVKVCSTCCFEAHSTHSYERYDQVVEKFARSIDDDVQQVTSRVECFRVIAAQLEVERNKLLDNASAVEQDVRDKAQKVIESAQRRMADLLQEVQSLKSAAEKEIDTYSDSLQTAVTEMDSFRTRSLELMSVSPPGDVRQAGKDVHDRAKELLQTHVIPSEYHAPRYKFTPINLDEVLTDEENFIGHVVKVDPGTYQLIQAYLKEAQLLL